MKKVLKSNLISFATALTMIFFVSLFKDFTLKNYMVLIGNGFLFSGTLGYLVDSSVRSWDGTTLPEKTNKWFLIIFYLAGFALILIFS